MEQSDNKFICYTHLHSFEGNNPNIVVPEGVGVIGSSAFQNNQTIKTLMLPASVLHIESSAFSGCNNLELADMSACENICSVNNGIFQSCRGLTAVKMPKRINEKTQFSIPWLCFADCHSLKDINLPEGTVKLDFQAFCDCRSLTHIKLPDSLQEIDQDVFYNCTALESIELYDGITRIGASTFKNCTSLTAVKLPSGIKAICSRLFDGCTSLKEVTIPHGVERIVLEAFKDCTSLSEVRLPDSITDIDENAFQGCKSLSRIYIPGSVEEIGKKAFAGCAKGFVLQSSNPKWRAYALKERLKFELIANPYTK